MDREARFCVFAKPPIAGQVKTRLAQVIGAEPAAQLAQAFLEDTCAMLQRVPWGAVVVALSDGPQTFAVAGTELWSQGEGDLGERIERVLRRALTRTPLAFALGADTPGLPIELLEQARNALQDHDAVLGPAEDGGFYLLGLRSVPQGLLGGLPWSSTTTLVRTRARLIERGLRVALLPDWFDVDHVTELKRLQAMLIDGTLHAPRTLEALRTLCLDSLAD